MAESNGGEAGNLPALEGGEAKRRQALRRVPEQIFVGDEENDGGASEKEESDESDFVDSLSDTSLESDASDFLHVEALPPGC